MNFANSQPNYDESFTGGGNYDPLPEAFYTCSISKVEDKATKAGTGRYLEFTFTIIDGDYSGRKLWSRVNYDNPSIKAVEIATKQLTSIAHATGVLTVNESTLPQFIDKLIDVHCYVVPADGTNKAKNEIDQYRPTGGTAPQAANTATAAPAKPAWQK
jgi:hypothetical protein